MASNVVKVLKVVDVLPHFTASSLVDEVHLKGHCIEFGVV